MLRRLVQESRSAGWWESYVDGLSTERYVLDNPARYAALETDATAVATFDVSVLHGLAQTRRYSRALLGQRLPRHQPWEIERLVEMLVHRKRALTRPGRPLRLLQVVDEAALRRVVGRPGGDGRAAGAPARPLRAARPCRCTSCRSRRARSGRTPGSSPSWTSRTSSGPTSCSWRATRAAATWRTGRGRAVPRASLRRFGRTRWTAERSRETLRGVPRPARGCRRSRTVTSASTGG